MIKKSKLVSDGFRISGPRATDNSFSITFTFGEYMQPAIVKFLNRFKPSDVLTLDISRYNENTTWQKQKKENVKVLVDQQ